MPNSMTGFGRAEDNRPGGRLVCEVRSVNHRFLSVKLKLSSPLQRLDPWIQQCLRAELSRGSVEVFLGFQAAGETAVAEFSAAAADRYLKSLRPWLRKRGLKQEVSPDLLCQLPGVMVPPDPATLAESIQPRAEILVKRALKQLVTMRSREGTRLNQALRREQRTLAQVVRKIRSRRGQVMKSYARRLRERVDQLLADSGVALDAATVAREVAVYADKSDVTEELDRLESHLQEFEGTLAREEPVGRALEFLVQELSREVHTVGSKTQDQAALAEVLRAKACVEKIREQVQNIE